jgi:hypothetical protein
MTFLLSDAYLCPGPAIGLEHVTDNPVCCDCGNENLVSLGRILNRKPTYVPSPVVETFTDRIWNRLEQLDS